MLINPQVAKAEIRAEKARRSLAEFIRQYWHLVDPGNPLRWGWHIDAIAAHLEAVTAGDILKLLINIPPGHAKSLIVSVFWPAWEWANTPTTQSIFTSYAAGLAERDSLRCRDLMLQEAYQDAFVVGRGRDTNGRLAPLWTFNPAQNRLDDFANTLKGHRQCLSVGSKVTGYRGQKVVCDDPINVTDATSKVERDTVIQWWSQAIPTRVNDPARAAFVIIMQRVHEDDLSGFVLQGGDYEHLCLPSEFDPERRAKTFTTRVTKTPEGPVTTRTPFYEDPRKTKGELLFPALFTREVIEKLKKPVVGLGAAGYAAQHDQSPAPPEGGMFKYASWRFWAYEGSSPRPTKCDKSPARALPEKLYQLGSLDAAFKDGDANDYVVFTVWGVRGAERFLLDCVRGKMDFTVTCAEQVRLAAKWPKCTKWLVEDKANGTAIVNSLKSKVRGLLAVDPKGGKEARASAMQPYVEAGQIYLPDGAPWVEAFVDEHAVFPVGKHDDQVDSASQAIVYLHNPDVQRLIDLLSSI